MEIAKSTMPLTIRPQYRWPSPVQQRERIAATQRLAIFRDPAAAPALADLLDDSIWPEFRSMLGFAGLAEHAASDERFDLVAQIAHSRNTGHARATFQRVQMSFQLFNTVPRILVCDPDAESSVSFLKQLCSFF